MRVAICLISLLCGCSTSAVRCDARLVPINAPATAGTAAHIKGAAGTQNMDAQGAP